MKVVDFIPCCQIVMVDKEVCIAKIMWNCNGNANLFVNVGIIVEKVPILENKFAERKRAREEAEGMEADLNSGNVRAYERHTYE
eukprot:14278170-Heterocapsa_arctica.AAC.1